jgi:hypothetical protein
MHLQRYVIGFTFPIFVSLNLSQYLRAVLFGKASINCGTSGRHEPKHQWWDVKKMTPRIIATAATIVYSHHSNFYLTDTMLYYS